MKNINSNFVKITKDTSDSLRLYHQEIRNLDEINKKKETELFIEYRQTRCPKIKELLVNNNLRFVINVAKYYHNSSFYELTDIISSGNIGLIKAVEDFDPNKGYKFSTYAVWWIKQAILEGIAKESKIIKQPIKLHSVNQKYLKIKNEFYNKYGFDPNIDDIREDLDEETASEIIAKSVNAIDDNNILSIYNSINNFDEFKFEEMLPTSILNDEFIYLNTDLNSMNLKNLNNIEKLIICYSYGLDDKPELSFSQISKMVSKSEKEVKKIHDNAIKKIKNDL
jgi:RNA polymerase sigma factor (sigma-70 family)